MPEKYTYHYAEAEHTDETKTVAQKLVAAARRVVERIRNTRSESDSKNKKFSKDVEKVMKKPPTRREALHEHALAIPEDVRATVGERPPKNVPITDKSREEFNKKVKEAKNSKKSPKAVEMLDEKKVAKDLKDERMQQVAERLLEIDESLPKDERKKKIREVAEEFWRLRVGSGYDNEAAEEARNYLWEMHGTYKKSKDFDPADKAELDQQFAELLRTSNYPPDIVIDTALEKQLGGFADKAKRRVSSANMRYNDLRMVGDVPEKDEFFIVPTSKSLGEDIDELNEAWSDYKKEYKSSNGGAEPSQSEEQAYHKVQKQFQDRIDEKNQDEIEERNRKEREKQLVDRQRNTYGQERRHIPNSMSPSLEEAEDLINDPIGTMDNILQELEAGVREYTQQGFDPETRLGRLRLLANYFLMDEFAAERMKDMQATIPGFTTDERDKVPLLSGIQTPDGELITSGPLFDSLQKARNEIRETLNLFGNDSEGYMKRFGEQRGKYIKEFTARFHAIQFFEAKSRAGNFNDERLLGMVAKGMTENDFLELSGIYGGLVEDANNLLTHHAVRLIRNDHGKEQRLTDVARLQAIQQTIDYMKQNKEMFEDTYNNYIKGLYFMDGSKVSLLQPLDPAKRKAKSYDEAVTAIVNLAAVQKDMWLDWDAIEMRGMSPLADTMFGSGEARYRPKRPMTLATKREHRFNFEQWDSLQGRPKLDRAHNRQKALFWMKHYAHDVEHEAKHDMEHFMHKLKHVVDHGKHGKEYKQMKERVKYLHFWNPDMYEFNDTDWENYIDKMVAGKVNKDLLEEFKVQICIDVDDTHGLRGFFPLESGWRKESVQITIDKMLGEYFGEDASKHRLFSARRLTTAADDYATIKLKHHHAHDEEHELWRVIKGGENHHTHEYEIGVAQMRPHDFASMMLEMEDPLFMEWAEHSKFGAEGVLGKGVNDKLTNLSMIVSSVNRELFRNVMEVTDPAKVKEYVPIDFTLDFLKWTPPQRETFSHVLSTMKLQKEDKTWHTPFAGKEQDVVQTMKSLYGFVTSEDALKRFSHVKYEGVLASSGPRWYDDLPLSMLQKPDRIAFLSEDKKKQMMSLGDYFSGKGMAEGSGPFKRTYTDNAGLESASKAQVAMSNTNEQEFRKLAPQLYLPVSTIAGPYHGAIVYQLEEFAREKMNGLTPEAARRAALFRPLGHNATLYRKYSGNQKADIIFPEEAHHLQEGMFEATVNALDEIPSFMHTKEEILRISTWDKWLTAMGVDKVVKARFGGGREGEKKYHEFVHYLNDMHPNLILRDKIQKIGLAAVVLTAVFLFYQAFSTGVGEAKSEAGGHH